MTHPFDFDKALSELQSGKDLTGKDGVLMPLIKQLTEAVITAELDHHLAHEDDPNRKNGLGSKIVKTGSGSFELNAPRDRAGTFEPELIKKHQTQLTPEIDRKIISLFSHGMSYRDIQYHLQDLYGVDVSTGALSAITDQLLPTLKEWQQRPLERIYPIMWMDAVHYKIKQDGRYIGKAVYTLLGLTLEGKKEILGLYLSENEGANYWLTVLTDIQNRGVEDILIACVDGLIGFPEAINSLYPQTEIQLCIIHQIRNSLKYVASKNQKVFMTDLKQVYRASSKENAEIALDNTRKNGVIPILS